MKGKMYMNKQESDILNVILQYHCRNQRALAERCGFSLGMVNRSVKALQGQGFLTTDMELTEKAKLEMAKQFLREQAQKTQKILSTEIIELAAQEGISKRTLETAKKELKIKAERCNNNWYWNLRA